MFSILLMATLMGSLTFATHIWAPGANLTGMPTNKNVAKRLTANNEGAWLGWGANVYNNRWAASRAVVDTSNVADLHPFCREAYSAGVSAAPLVLDEVAYYVTWSGAFIALDYTSCRVLWQTNVTDIILGYQPVDAIILSIATPVSRTTPVVEGNSLFIGTLANALLLAVDKRDGKLIDAVQISKHPLGIITQSPTLWQSRVFVGSASEEEQGAALIPGYVCCSFIGSMNAFTFEDGRFRLLWTQYMIPQGSNFSGAAIWGAQPSIDPVRNQVFIATGNVYSTPPQYTVCQNKTTVTANTLQDNTTNPCVPRTVYQESVLAFDAATGHINWSQELSPLDAWNVACNAALGIPIANPSACPPSPGPDADFGMAPSFVPASEYTPFGKDTLVVGQKNGNLYAICAQSGELFWATGTSPDGYEGGLIWGIAVDANAVYYTAANTYRKPWRLHNGTSISNSAFGALNLTNGTILWETPATVNGSSLVPPSIVNDAVLVGRSASYAPTGASNAESGSLVSLDKRTGSILKEWALDSYFQGAIAAVNDTVMFGTGYAGRQGSFNVWQLAA